MRKVSTRLVNPHQRCGYSDWPFTRIHYFYTAGSRNELEGVGAVAARKSYPRKTFVFIEKYTDDARQDEKHVPDLLEPIIQPTDPVKEELRPILFKIDKFRPKIPKFKVSIFWLPEFRSFRATGQCQPSHQ